MFSAGRRVQLGIKRIFDIVVSGVVLLVASPLLALIAALVAATTGWPVLFRQRRPGLQGAPFTLVKFRTMRDPAFADEPDAARLTGIGRALRASSLDELPELWNVLIGDMSLVGPRPLLMEYLPLYSAEQARRHEMRPGLTGLAQVSGRNLVSWPERFRLDVAYVDRFSLWLDAKILLRTIAAVFRRDGVSAEGHATMPKFEGETGARRDMDSRPPGGPSPTS